MRVTEGSVHAQYQSWSRNIEGTRNGYYAATPFSSSTQCGNSPPFPRRRLLDGRQQYRQSLSPPPTTSTLTEHRFEPQSPPRRLPGTFEYGYTYGSSSYRQDQTTFLGTPRLHTRYQPDHVNHRHLNRSLHEPRRRQFSPFMPFQRYPEKFNKEERYCYRGPVHSENYRTREFPINHDWDDSSSLHDPPSPNVYSAGALVIWKEEGYYGFLCDKNTLHGNLHFYADSDTVTEEEENKPLGKLPLNRLKRGHRVEIEAEFIEPDVSDPDTHHLIYVRKLLKIGTDACLEPIRPRILVPLTKGKTSPYYRALCETGDLVYIHPSILLAQSLLEFMKQHLISCRPLYVQDSLSIICSNQTIRGYVTIAPRWIGDAMGRLCNLKRILLMCEPYGDVMHGYGTIVKVVHEVSINIRPHSSVDLVQCSLISVPSEPKASFKVGGNVRYTACLDLPNSTYKWRCLGIARISKIDMVEESKQQSNVERNLIDADLPTGSRGHVGGKSDDDRKQEFTEKTFDEPLIRFETDGLEQEEPKKCKNFAMSGEQSSIGLSMARPLGYSAETHVAIPLCMNESPKKLFRYGDEPDCHFTIRDEMERSQYANFSPLYKSMEDFLLRHMRRRGKQKRRSRRTETASDTAGDEKSQYKNENLNTSARMDAIDESQPSTKRFHFVGIGDNISQLMAARQHQEPPPMWKMAPHSGCSSGWWYRRSKPRLYPTVVVAEFIRCRDKAKDCSENINVHKLQKTITIRNSGEFTDDGLHRCPAEKADTFPVVMGNRNEEPNIITLLQNDPIVGNFFETLVRKYRNRNK